MPVPVKERTRALLYQNTQHYALIDPTGKAVQLGTESVCIGEYYKRRFPKRIVFGEDELEHAKTLLTASGWQVVNVRFGVFTHDVGDLKQLLAAAS